MSLSAQPDAPPISYLWLLPCDAHAAATIDHGQLAWSLAEWERQLNANRLDAVGAYVAGDLVGLVVTEARHERLGVVKLCVHPRHQRKGIGSALAQRVMDRVSRPSHTRRAAECIIPTRRDYLPAACMLRKLGWHGREKDAGRNYVFRWGAPPADLTQIVVPEMVP